MKLTVMDDLFFILRGNCEMPNCEMLQNTPYSEKKDVLQEFRTSLSKFDHFALFL